MAGVASLADVNVAAGDLEWRVDAHVRRVLHRLMDGEERSDLDEAADAGDDDDRQHETDCLAFQPVMEPEHVVHSAGCRTGPPAGARSGAGRSRVAAGIVIVIQML